MEKSLAIESELDDKQGVAEDNRNLGLAYSIQKDGDNAKRHLQLSYELYGELGMTHDAG